MLAHAPASCFSKKKIMFSLFKVTNNYQKAMSKVRTIICCSKYYKIKLRLHEERRSPAIIWVCFWFSSICFNEISQNFHNTWQFSCQSFKNRKKGVTKAVSSLFAILITDSYCQLHDCSWTDDFSWW